MNTNTSSNTGKSLDLLIKTIPNSQYSIKVQKILILFDHYSLWKRVWNAEETFGNPLHTWAGYVMIFMRWAVSCRAKNNFNDRPLQTLC